VAALLDEVAKDVDSHVPCAASGITWKNLSYLHWLAVPMCLLVCIVLIIRFSCRCIASARDANYAYDKEVLCGNSMNKVPAYIPNRSVPYVEIAMAKPVHSL